MVQNCWTISKVQHRFFPVGLITWHGYYESQYEQISKAQKWPRKAVLSYNRNAFPEHANTEKSSIHKCISPEIETRARVSVAASVGTCPPRRRSEAHWVRESVEIRHFFTQNFIVQFSNITFFL